MTLTVDIPDDLVTYLGDSPGERARCAREAIAIHLYREGRITLRTMGAMVGVGDDYWSAEAFRISNHIPLTVDEASEDAPALAMLRKGA